MPIRFKKSLRNLRFLDPTQGFQEHVSSFEFRLDPLTRRRSRVTALKFRLLKPPDLGAVIDKSTQRPCPFCRQNLETMTPKFVPDFVPDGRIAAGSALVFPNFMPYDQHNAIAIFSTEHFIGLSDFSESQIVDGLLASQKFFHRVSQANSKNKYFCVNWNYMPPSGGSLVHPHLHLMADKEPSDHHALLLRRGKRFWKKFNVNYWAALIEEEKKRGIRYLGETGGVCWLLYFAPKGMMFDVMGIFVENQSILNATTDQFRDFASGLRRIFAYLVQNNLHSFNLAIFSGLNGKDHFWTHARLIPRFTIPPIDTSDVSFTGLLHDESLAIIRPEDVCKELKPYF